MGWGLESGKNWSYYMELGLGKAKAPGRGEGCRERVRQS